MNEARESPPVYCVPTAELRRGLAGLLVRIHDGDHIMVTHYDRSAAVMVPPGWYERASRLMEATDNHDPE